MTAIGTSGQTMLFETENDPEFSQPTRQILLMVLVLILVGIGVFLIYRQVAEVFLANLYLNGFILGVFVIGVLACFWQVLLLVTSVSWIEGFALNRPGHEFVQPPRLLTSLASMLKDKRARQGISTSSARSLLESIATRLDEARDITRYIINLLIFLGLLGTFYGLATTVPAVVDTIRSLTPPDGDTSGASVFENMMTGIEAQLAGMGTAFASSLLGLAGSLIVGILELFAGHGQNRFYTELENWLSSITRLTMGNEGGETGVMADVMDNTATRIEQLSAVVASSDDARRATDQRLDALVGAVENLTVQIAQRESDAAMLDEETRARLRNIDIQLLRMLEEMSAGRQDSVAELRTEISALTNALTRER